MTGSAEDVVLVVSHEASRTGSVLQLLSVLEQWSAKGRRFETVVRRRGPLLERFYDLAPTACLTPPWAVQGRRAFDRARRGGWFDAAALARPALRPIRRQEWRATLLNTATHGDLVAHLPPAPALTWVHEQGALLDRLTRPADLHRLNQTGRFAAVSASVRSDLVRSLGIDPDRVEIINPAPAPRDEVGREQARRALLDELRLPPDVVLVGACGALSWEKSPESWLDLADAVGEDANSGGVSVPPIAFVWLGEGPSPSVRERLAEQAKARGLDTVHFLGARSNPLPFFAALDLFAVVSVSDSFPLAALEAARESVPVLCFGDAGGIKEFVRDDAGVVIEPRDLPRMSRELVRLAADAGLRAKLGSTAATRVRVEHRPDITADRLWSALVGPRSRN